MERKDTSMRRRWSGMAIAMAAVAGSVVTLTTSSPVFAAAPRVVGTFVLDTNADGVANGGTLAGENEPAYTGGANVALVCSNGTVLATTTASTVDGTYAFEDIVLVDGNSDPLCPTGEAFIRSTITNNKYSITDGAGADNDTPRTGGPQIGRSANFALTVGTDETINTLARPDWFLTLGIPTDGSTGQPAVYTGTPTFDSVCPQAGNDCSAQDLVVRNQDTVTFTWAITASSLDDLSTSNGDVVLEQTINLDPDGPGGNPASMANFARIPVRCKPSGGGGTPPPTSQIVAQPSGTVVAEGAMPPAGTTSVTLTCNLGVWTQTGDALTLQPVVKISGTSPEGSQLSSSARAYAVDNNIIPTMNPTSALQFGPIDVTAAPAYDLEKKGFFNRDAGFANIGAGSEAGYYTYAVIQIKTDRRAGVEALAQPITITEDIFGFFSNGTSAYPGAEFAITQCIPNPTGWSGTVGGQAAPYGDFTVARSNQTVISSGSCAYTRNTPGDLTSDYTLTFNGIDMSGARYPTQNANGSDLSAGPFYVASYRVQVFIPLRTLDGGDGVVGNNAGSLVLYNRVGDFDPNGVSGTSNYGTDLEPGYCTAGSVDGNDLAAAGMPFCDTMPTTGARSNNVIGPTSFIYGPGQFAKYLLNQTTMYSGAWTPLPQMTSAHDGAGVGQPGQVVDTHLNWINDNAPAWTDSRICDIFDNTMLKLVPSTQTVTGGSSNIYSWLSATGPGTGDGAVAAAQAYNAKWIFEYAHIDTTGDNPISGGTINPTTGRFNGTWTAQRNANCDDGSAVGGWFTDPNLVGSGIDDVNAIRVRPGIDPATGVETTHNFGVNNRLNFGMEIRNAFYGGPNAGQAIPAGAVAANFGRVRADQYNGGAWIGRSYQPSPETTNVDGDRVTITRADLAIQKRTIAVDGIGDGVADFGNTGQALAGNAIVWEIVSSLSADIVNPAPVDNVVITDILPVYASYDPDCTALLTGGTPADVVQYDTPTAGRTTLIWNLGTLTPNVAIPNRRICTNSDPLAPQGATLVNRTTISASGVVGVPFDDHTVGLEQTGEIKMRKTVDAPVDVLNDDQAYTLSGQNFSNTLTIASPTVIEVFPYNGDATPPGGVNRTPGSDFTGELVLTGAATVTNISGGAFTGTFTYTADAPSTINQNLNLNTNTWCLPADFGSAGCPVNFGDVTGFKMVAGQNLTPIGTVATSGFTIRFTLQAGDTVNPFSATANRPNDVYANRFTMFSSTFTGSSGFQVLASNRVAVRTVSHSVGDWVFEDRDGDGSYTAGTDVPVADGTPITLWYVPSVGSPTQVGSTTTSGGRYVFRELPSGDYYVEIPASAFNTGQPLADYVITTAPAATNVDENDSDSHDTVAGSGGSIRSTTFTLSATVNSTTGAIAGDEPTAENIHGVTDTTTTDPFSNLAIDLAIVGPPALTLTKDVCTAANVADCVVGTDSVWDADAARVPLNNLATWRISVTNTGSQVLSPVVITDPVTPSCARTLPAALAVGATFRYVCTGLAVTEPDTAPRINTAFVNANPMGYDPDDSDPADNLTANDPAEVSTDVEYDLALAKVGTTSSVVYPNAPVFTVRVYNQGNYPSGAVSVRDQLPTGLAFTATGSTAGCTAGAGNIVTCSIADIAAGAFVDLAIATTVSDWGTAPWRNWAEIASDSGAALYGVPDADSVPELTENNGIGADNTVNPDGYTSVATNAATYSSPSLTDSDDGDDGTVTSANSYDLAIAKIADVATVDNNGDPIAYTITVANQGTFPSGDYTLVDTLPAGLTAPTAITNGGVWNSTARTITWDLTGLAAGAETSVGYSSTIADITLVSWRNFAEITADSATDYGTITDADSTPNDGDVDDNVDIDDVADAGLAGDAGRDDEDLALVTSDATYDLALAKVADATAVEFGDTVHFTITVENQGSLASGSFTVVDTVPASLTPVAASITDGGVWNATARTITWTVAVGSQLAATETTTFEYDVTVTSLAGPFRNIAEITADSAADYGLTDVDSIADTDVTNDGNYDTAGVDNASIADAGNGVDPEDDADAAILSNSDRYDLALAKAAALTGTGEAASIDYTITVLNQGTLDSGDFTVVDQVPAGLVVNSASITNSGTYDSATRRITWNLTGLAPVAQLSLTYTVTVSDLTQRPFRNVAEISADSAADYGLTDADSTPDTNIANDGDYDTAGVDNASIADAGVAPDPSDDADIADVDIPITYDLALVKSAPATMGPLGDVIFTITIANQGDVASGSYVVTDTLPAGMEATAASNAGDFTTTPGIVTWNLSGLAAGATTTVTITATITDLTARPFKNIAEISADGADIYDAVNVAAAQADIEDADSSPDAITTNDNAAPSGDGYGTQATPTNDVTTVAELATVANGEDDADVAFVATTVIYDLAVVKTAPASILPSGVARFSIVIENQGNVPSGSYTVTDAVPAGMEAVAASDGGDISSPTTSVSWNLSGLEPGATRTITVDMRIVDITQRPFRNAVEITADSSDLYSTPTDTVTDTDSVPGDADTSDVDNTLISEAGAGDDTGFDDEDVATVGTTVVYDLALVKTVDAATIAPDGTATFTVTIANQGNVPSGVFTVTDTLPAGTEFVSASNAGTHAAGVVTWNMASIDAGLSVSVTVVVRPVDLTRRPYRNVAEITADSSATYSSLTEPVTDADSVPGDTASSTSDNTLVSEAGVGADAGFDDEDIALFDVTVVYDLALVKLVAPAQSYIRGSVINYEIQVKNQGNVPSGIYTVQDVIPTGMSFVGASDGGTLLGGAVTWTDLVSLAAGETKVLTLGLRLDDVTLQQYRNYAEIAVDSSATYSTPSNPVFDKDSTPDFNPANDAVIDNDDVNLDSLAGDEDDGDVALLSISAIAIANQVPAPVTPPGTVLPRTGSDVADVLLYAATLLGAGWLLMIGGRRRRTRTTA